MDATFIQLTDALTGLPIIVRADLIFKIEYYKDIFNPLLDNCDKRVCVVTFTNDKIEYVTDEMDEILDALSGGNS